MGVFNAWVETRISHWMVAMIDEALGKRRRYEEPSTRAPTLKHVRFVKNGYRGIWLLPIWPQLLTNFLYLCFAFTVQDHLAPMLLENFTYILNSWSSNCSHCPFPSVRSEHSVCHGILMNTYLVQHWASCISLNSVAPSN